MIVYYHKKTGYGYEKWDRSDGGVISSFTPGRYTVAVELPTKEQLFSLISTSVKTLEIPIGIACAHPSDQFNKKIGRELSKRRMEPVVFTLDRVQVDCRAPFQKQKLVFVLEARYDQKTYVNILQFTLTENLNRPIVSSVIMQDAESQKEKQTWYSTELSKASEGKL